MLRLLRVKDLAIMDALEVEFGPGLNIVTGETGAGKSILVGALKLVLGGKAHPGVVRTGKKQAQVEAVFELASEGLREQLEQELGIELDTAEDACAQGERRYELILRRTISAQGKSRAYIGGALATARQLSLIAEALADISSQHEHHRLVDARCHLAYLDEFAQVTGELATCKTLHERLRGVSQDIEELLGSEATRRDQLDLLRYQLGEIDELAPTPGELDTLEAEARRLRHADKLLRASANAEAQLYADDDALCSRLSHVVSELDDIVQLDTDLEPLRDRLAAARAEVEDIAQELGGYARAVSLDPERHREVEERIRALEALRRKYGGSIEAALERRDHAAKEIARFENRDEELEALRDAYAKVVTEAETVAGALRKKRKAAANRLGKAITSELESLGMGHAEVVVDVEPLASKAGSSDNQDEQEVLGARFSPRGIDKAEFRIATNRGEAPRPLREIASGGELSRAMLATKRVLAGLGPVGLYVFDEVDTGVGGGVAEIIGRKLKDVAGHHQVICITHLPQIAAFADIHYKVHKAEQAGRTVSHIDPLSETERVEEMARMLGGLRVTDTTLSAAGELLEGAREGGGPPAAKRLAPAKKRNSAASRTTGGRTQKSKSKGRTLSSAS